MRRVRLLAVRLLAALLLVLLTACASKQQMPSGAGNLPTEAVRIRELPCGLYAVDGQPNAPYIFLDPDSQAWRTGASLFYSFAILGQCRLQGNTLIATDGNGLEMALTPLSESALQISALQVSQDDSDFWLSEGMVLQLLSLEE